ncbi:MAG: 50S ribosomal protein L19e [Candidatus Anstonellales archaeon]
MSVHTVKRLAADIMRIGMNRVRIKPDSLGKVKEALTREDVKALIKDGIVYKVPPKGNASLNKRTKKKRAGKRKGAKYSRKGRKSAWMERIRSLRSYLAKLLKEGKLDKSKKREIYAKIKGGHFKGKRPLYTYLKEVGYIKE